MCSMALNALIWEILRLEIGRKSSDVSGWEFIRKQIVRISIYSFFLFLYPAFRQYNPKVLQKLCSKPLFLYKYIVLKEILFFLSTARWKCVSHIIDGADCRNGRDRQKLNRGPLSGRPDGIRGAYAPSRRQCAGIPYYDVRKSGQAEDFFQETFQRVHEKAHTFKGGQLKSWLLTIATRVAINGLRRNRQLKVVSLNQRAYCADGDCEESRTMALADNSCNPFNSSCWCGTKGAGAASIGCLPAKQRATLVLAYYQQLSYPKWRQNDGLFCRSVKTQMYRALRTLSQSCLNWENRNEGHITEKELIGYQFKLLSENG